MSSEEQIGKNRFDDAPDSARRKPNRRKRLLIFVGAPTLLIGVGSAVLGTGFLSLIPGLFEIYCAPKRKADARSSLQNLKAMGVALTIYLDANDAYPPKESWADEIENYMRTADMDPEETRKKLKAPQFADAKDQYGFAYNGELSSRWRDEVSSPAETPCIYDSTKTERNAFDQTPLESLPSEPREGGNAILFADGHAAPAKK